MGISFKTQWSQFYQYKLILKKRYILIKKTIVTMAKVENIVYLDKSTFL